MFYRKFAILFFSLQFILILGTNFNVWPEMFLFSRMAREGLIPYRDFFDHHGFLMYYLLAPFSSPDPWTGLKIAYLLIQSANLAFVLVILRRIASPSGYVLAGFLWVVVAFFISENNLWYETAVTMGYLAAYVLLMDFTRPFRLFLAGIAIGCTVLVKPVAAIVIFPLTLMIPKKKFFVAGFVFATAGGAGFLLNYGAFSEAIIGVIRYNGFLSSAYRNPFWSDGKFLAVSLGLAIGMIVLIWIQTGLRKIGMTLSFFIASFVFLSLGYGREHLLPVFTFGIILVGYMSRLPRNIWKDGMICCLVLYALVMTRKVIFHQQYLSQVRVVWNENAVSREVIEKLNASYGMYPSIYVFGSQAEIYIETNRMPLVYTPILFPLIDQWDPNLENRIINDLVNNRVSTVIVMVPEESVYARLAAVKDYIRSEYALIDSTPDYLIYSKRMCSGL